VDTDAIDKVTRSRSASLPTPYNLLRKTNVQHLRSVLLGRMMFHSTITVIPPMGAKCARLLLCCVEQSAPGVRLLG
jgi:hypothetical protein